MTLALVSSGRVSIPEWADRRRTEVVERVRSFVERRASAPAQRALLRTALLDIDVRASRAPAGAFLGSVHLPLLVYAALGGGEERATPLAVATTLVELGVDLLDHIADREVSPHWRGQSPAAIQLAAVEFLCALPQLALAEIDAPPARVARLHRILAEQFLRIGLGQQIDLALAGSSLPRLDEVEDAVAGKSGERGALFVRLATELARAPEEAGEAYAAAAREYGIARQLASDVADLAAGERSRDLASGARTWPIAWLLNRSDGEARQYLLELLDRARGDDDARRGARRILIDKGALTRTAVEANLHRDAALRALDRARPLPPAADVLRAMISLAGWTDADA
jgi:geranylgeranyl pyrophosphate synthase